LVNALGIFITSSIMTVYDNMVIKSNMKINVNRKIKLLDFYHKTAII